MRQKHIIIRFICTFAVLLALAITAVVVRADDRASSADMRSVAFEQHILPRYPHPGVDKTILLSPLGQNRRSSSEGLRKSSEAIPYRYYPSGFDIPLEINDEIWEILLSMQFRGSRGIRRWLERSGHFVPIMKEIFREEGAPTDLVYLSMIESGYNLMAHSSANAIGPWQFMESTGRRYGLKIEDWVDERHDFELSTRAAARHLMDDFGRFGDWPLAIAAYNAGYGKIYRALKKSKKKDFWGIANEDFLRPETINFVPKYFAALIISKNPEKFGFSDIKYKKPLYYNKITVPPLTDLRVIARESGADFDEVFLLNAQYIFECTPPFKGKYTVKVPVDCNKGVEKRINALDKKERNLFVCHKVGHGETIDGIALEYGVPEGIILQTNGIAKSHSLKKKQDLIIPIRKGDSRFRAWESGRGDYVIYYMVKKDDTLSGIAGKAGVSVHDLARWNKIDQNSIIHPGQRLKIHVKSRYQVRHMGATLKRVSSKSSSKKSSKSVYYTVEEGDTLWGIAQKYSTTVNNLCRWNSIKEEDILRPGYRLKIYR